MVLVDTSVWIEASRRTGSLAAKVALENLLEEYEAVWCSVVKLEFLGAARKEEGRKLSFWLECIPYREVQERHWERAVRNAWLLRSKGLNLPWNDILIASLAMEEDFRVFAQDKHFDAMAHTLGLVLYRPGYGGIFTPE
jgi:predicted nucleic acid-binding protein